MDGGHHPSVVVIFLYGVFWRRAGGNATLATLIGGHGVPAACFAATLTGRLDLCLALIAGLMFAGNSYGCTGAGLPLFYSVLAALTIWQLIAFW